MSFFTPDQNERCEKGAYTDGFLLTTNTLPFSFTCFNLADIFAPNSSSVGFQNGTDGITPLDPDAVNGVHYQIRRPDGRFDPNGNYSNVWYEQYNSTELDEGKDASWVVHFYAFEDCEQQEQGHDEREPEDFPWFETSCQTEVGGQCREVPNTVRSFGINSGANYNARHGGCEEWAFLGGANGVMPGKGLMLALGIGAVAVLGLM